MIEAWIFSGLLAFGMFWPSPRRKKRWDRMDKIGQVFAYSRGLMLCAIFGPLVLGAELYRCLSGDQEER